MAQGWKVKITTTNCDNVERSEEEDLFNKSTMTNKQTEE
jgi:hypothetical protein